MATVTFDHVSKAYADDVLAVNDLNLDIKDSEFLVLVGPSGCGKTTALRCLAGLEDITDGDIKIDDRVVNDLSPKQRNIAMVFQSYALYPHMTVFDNLGFGLKLSKTPKAEIKKRVNEAATILDLEEFLDLLAPVHKREDILIGNIGAVTSAARTRPAPRRSSTLRAATGFTSRSINASTSASGVSRVIVCIESDAAAIVSRLTL